ncbi:radical SAM/SPASM domain-containing protein [Helicobacter turcicus]|uniref:radical SAM/SPASM domain-containing protein n=1 Tax=Helicobacter turcicus TaxID=2867412 RepID=UPI001C883A95|nr:radical SAM protein [Helicobacter turcicus]
MRGGGILVAFNIDLVDYDFKSIQKVILAEQNSYFAFCNPYEKVKTSVFFKLVCLDNFPRYAVEYAYKNRIIDRQARNQMHSKWNLAYKTQFYEDRRLYNLSSQWNVVKDSFFEYPKTIWIALLNICNTNCLFCHWFGFSLSKTLRNDYFKTDKKIADAQVEKILQYAGKAKAKCIFSGPGEPLLDDRLESFVKRSKEYGVESVEIATNGVLLTPQKFLRLVEAGANSWEISVCFTKETYAQCEENFFESFKKRLIEITKLIESLKIPLFVRFAIIYEEHRMPEMLEFWNRITKLSNRISVSVDCYAESGQFVDSNHTEEIRIRQERHICSAPFANLYVFPSGDVGHCAHQRHYLGREDTKKFCIGNVYQQDLEEIWNGVAHKSFCQSHRKKDFTSQLTVLCDSCNAWWNELEG